MLARRALLIPIGSIPVEPGIQNIQLLRELTGQLVAELLVELPDALDLVPPEGGVHAQQAPEGVQLHAGVLQIDVLGPGLPANGSLHCLGLPEAAVQDPLQPP